MQNKNNQFASNDLNIDVTRIVKYTCISSVLIVGIIFGTKILLKMLQIKKDKN